jgi:hypothetical protein
MIRTSGSSSTSSTIFSLVAVDRPAAASDSSAWLTASILGSRIVIVVPCPASLSISIWPPDYSTNPCTMLSPSPVPSPSGLVVKNGSNTRLLVKWSMFS